MSPSDEELIALTLASGDRRAYGELVKRHQSQVRAWLRQLTGGKADADDLAQETFLKAWEKLGTLSAHGKFSAWLMKLAYNEFLQVARKNARRDRLARQYEEEAEVQSPDSSGPVSAHVSEAPDLPRMLAVLGEQERHVMLLGYACGYTHAEISEILGLAVGTVKSHMHRGKIRIRDAFGLEQSS